MTTEVELPALDGREPLGFLAALGLLRLLAEHDDPATRLRFSEMTATAHLSGRYGTVQEIVETVNRIVVSMPGAIPEVPADFPTAKVGTGPDPMRVDQRELDRIWPEDPAAARWMSVLLTDVAADNGGRAALTPFSAPSGQQSIRTFFEKPLTAVRKEPARIMEALTEWRRVDGFTGEYLDHRVLRSAADHPTGESVEAGVPGATWLAIMALPLFRLTGDGRSLAATCWHRIQGRRQPVMVWPLWRQPLDVSAVQVIIEHPLLRPRISEDGQISVRKDHLEALGIFRVGGAERQRVQGRNFAGVLAPVTSSLDAADGRSVL